VLGSFDLVAFVASTDLARTRAFYETVLGLRLLEEGPMACLFDASGTRLRATLVGEVAGAPYTVLGWNVVDIATTAQGLRQRGVDFLRFDGMAQDELGVWLAPGGAQVAWFADPDGNILSLTEDAARRAE